MARYLITDSELTALESKIKEVTGISGSLMYPEGFVSAIETLDFPPPTTITLYDLVGNESWNGVINDNTITTLSYQAFISNSLLTSVCFINCTNIQSMAFKDCSNLVSISFPECSIIYTNAFRNCTTLQDISLPKCEKLDDGVFQNCKMLEIISLPVCSFIDEYAFASCINLKSIYLYSTAMVQLSSSNTFRSNTFTNSSYLGYFGSIFVPSILLTTYQNNSIWSYFSERFVGV